MIQITRELQTSQDTHRHTTESTITTSDPYILRRIIYTFILVAFLLAACFYFDFLSDYDLVTMVLGFVVCIILQFIVLSSFFNQQMKELQTDEIGVLKEKIKMIFGQLNPVRVQLKSRKKYYHRESNEEDKLFTQQNDAIYQNVMAHLSVKGEPNFNELINKVKGKWQQLQNKVRKIQQFLTSVLKLYQSRKLVYFKQKNRLKRLHQNEEHTYWAQFLIATTDPPTKNQNLNNTSYYSQDEQAFFNNFQTAQMIGKNNINEQWKGMQVNWGIMNIYLLQKIKLAEKQFSDLKDRVYKQFECFAATVRASNIQYTKARQKLYQDFKASDLDKNNILRELQKTASKIVEVSQGLSNRVGGGGQIQLTMKRQFELRLLKIQSQNLLIRLSKAQSCCMSYTDQLYRNLQAQGRELDYLLQIINNKIHQYNHQMAGFGQNRAPAIKKIIEEGFNKKYFLQPINVALQGTADDCYSKILSRRNNQGTFRSHLEQLLKFFEDVRQEHSKTSKELKIWRDNFYKNSGDNMRESKVMGQSSEARFLQFTKGINDQKLLRMFDVVNDLQDITCKKIYHTLEREIQSLKQFQLNQGSIFAQDVRRYFDDYKKKQNEYIRLSKRGNKQQQELTQRIYFDYENSKNKLIDYINEYAQKKIKSYLPDIIKIAIQNQQGYEKIASQIDTDRANDQRNQFTSSEDTKYQKYEAFTNCIYKSEGELIIDEILRNEKFSYEDNIIDSEINTKYLIDLGKESQETQDKNVRNKKPQKISDFFKYQSSVPKTLSMLNNILGILFHEWSNSELFHEFIREQLILVSLNRKKPDIVEHLKIDFFRIVQRDKDTPIVKNLRPHSSQIYRCLFDLHVNFKGKIAVKISSRFKIGKRPNLQIKLLIKQFECPIRICFTPFTIGKSYVSFLARPKIVLDYSVAVGNFFLTKIPFFTQFIETYIVLKLRKKFLWPKRMTLSVPLAFKSTFELAIQQRHNFEKEKQRVSKKAK